MITKERWLTVRNLTEMPMDVWFEFYKEKGGLLQDFDQFVHYFTLSLFTHFVVNGQVIKISLGSATSRIHNHYNTKYNLWG